MQVLWPRKKDVTIQGILLIAIGVLDILIALVFGSKLSTVAQTNSLILGLIVVFLAVGLLRSRIFVSDAQIGVRNMWRTHRFAWNDVTGIVVAAKQVTLVKQDGTVVPCMALSPRVDRPEAQAAIDTIKTHIPAAG
jgi:hypothetical protein